MLLEWERRNPAAMRAGFQAKGLPLPVVIGFLALR